jgi:hypothetical protein
MEKQCVYYELKTEFLILKSLNLSHYRPGQALGVPGS